MLLCKTCMCLCLVLVVREKTRRQCCCYFNPLPFYHGLGTCQVVLWDMIIERKEDAKLHLSREFSEYSLMDKVCQERT